MESIKSLEHKRIVELDGLRGIAILLVVSFHYVNNQLVNSQAALGKILAKLTSFGWIGVDLFFVLSGFLIGSVLLRTKESKKFFSTFYIRRLLRIVPNYYLLLLLFILVSSIPYFSTDYMLAGNQSIPIGSYFAMVHNFYMASSNNMGNGLLSISWSIGIEEQFYIIFPLILYIIKENWLPFILVITIVTASLFRMQYTHWIPAYVLLPARMDSISIGILVAYFYRDSKFDITVKKYMYFIIVVLVIVVVFCLVLYTLYGDLGVIRHTLFAIAFAILLVLALAKIPVYSPLLRNKMLCWVGGISYSLYLFHYFVLILFHHFIGNRDGIVIANWIDFLTTTAALAFSFLLSWFIFRFIETPMVNIGKTYKY